MIDVYKHFLLIKEKLTTAIDIPAYTYRGQYLSKQEGHFFCPAIYVEYKELNIIINSMQQKQAKTTLVFHIATYAPHEDNGNTDLQEHYSQMQQLNDYLCDATLSNQYLSTPQLILQKQSETEFAKHAIISKLFYAVEIIYKTTSTIIVKK